MQYGTSMALNPYVARRARASPCAAPGGRSRRRRWRVRPGSARRRPPAVERSGCGRNVEGDGAAAPAQWPGGPSPGAAAPARPGEWTATTVGVHCRPETLSPSWGRQCSSMSTRSGADSEQPRQINGEGGGAAAPAQWPGGPSQGQQLRISPANGQQRQSGYIVGRRHSPSWGKQCSVTTTRSGAGQQLQINGEGCDLASSWVPYNFPYPDVQALAAFWPEPSLLPGVSHPQETPSRV
jgi:hypothetical protein